MAGLEKRGLTMQREFNQDVTVYNRWPEGDGERWQRTVLHSVAVMDRRGEAIRHSGAASSQARRMGPVNVGEICVLIPQAGRVGYQSEEDWPKLTDHAGQWTLRPGDLLLPGVCEDEVGESAATLLETGKRVGVIGTVTARGENGPLAHWEVMAR